MPLPRTPGPRWQRSKKENICQYCFQYTDRAVLNYLVRAGKGLVCFPSVVEMPTLASLQTASAKSDIHIANPNPSSYGPQYYLHSYIYFVLCIFQVCAFIFIIWGSLSLPNNVFAPIKCDKLNNALFKLDNINQKNICCNWDIFPSYAMEQNNTNHIKNIRKCEIWRPFPKEIIKLCLRMTKANHTGDLKQSVYFFHWTVWWSYFNFSMTLHNNRHLESQYYTSPSPLRIN